MIIGTGSILGGYRIERTLGSGGMGTVYLAEHPTLGRYVALKVLWPQLAFDPEYRARFEREAKLAAGLDHPNVVAVQNKGEDRGYLWIALQYVNGMDAATALELDPEAMSPGRALRIVGEIGKGLDYAHRSGLLHRDVKPANFLLAPQESGEERVLLADFGIAKPSDDDSQLTRTGTFLATVAYASPEQLSGEPLDSRSDVYSLGCSFYRLLTGENPYRGAQPLAVMMGHINAPPPRITDVRPDLPAELDEVLARVLAKNPGDRYDDCAQFFEAAGVALARVGAPGAGYNGHGDNSYGDNSGHGDSGYGDNNRYSEIKGHGETQGYGETKVSTASWPVAGTSRMDTGRSATRRESRDGFGVTTAAAGPAGPDSHSRDSARKEFSGKRSQRAPWKVVSAVFTGGIVVLAVAVLAINHSGKTDGGVRHAAAPTTVAAPPPTTFVPVVPAAPTTTAMAAAQLQDPCQLVTPELRRRSDLGESSAPTTTSADRTCSWETSGKPHVTAKVSISTEFMQAEPGARNVRVGNGVSGRETSHERDGDGHGDDRGFAVCFVQWPTSYGHIRVTMAGRAGATDTDDLCSAAEDLADGIFDNVKR
ncbi:serine/threonine-protein kinase [Nocardia sp. NBC_01388]|uniref:serine/threonine-protein kinase n=1 Tax=Nocardia sp. NBC_01388 TaxID=2903596 RepID=UPI0032461896